MISLKGNPVEIRDCARSCKSQKNVVIHATAPTISRDGKATTGDESENLPAKMNEELTSGTKFSESIALIQHFSPLFY
jgi:hypothetical protein